MRQVVIIGSGPAALAAAIYTARAELKPLVIASSIEPFGALMNTTDVDNYPGFEEGIQGPELMAKMTKQAERFGAEIVFEDVIKINKGNPALALPHEVILDNGEAIETNTIIYATGSAHRKLGLPKEDDFGGMGISYCAVCDAAFAKDETVVVVGGGDTAMEDAVFAAKYAEKVFLLVRGDKARASKATLKLAEANPKVEILYNHTVDTLHGEDALEGVTLYASDYKAYRDLKEVRSLFVAIGSDPRVHLLHSMKEIEFTESGSVKMLDRSSRTNVPGLFVAGDITDSRYKQAGVATGTGIIAALDVEEYLNHLA